MSVNRDLQQDIDDDIEENREFYDALALADSE